MRRLFGILIFLAAGFAQAAPVQYVFQGIGTGTLRGVAFTDTAFEIKLFSDTDRLRVEGSPAYAIVKNEYIGGELFIAGVTSEVLTNSYGVFHTSDGFIGIERSISSLGVLGATFPGAGYDEYSYFRALRTTFGPVTGSSILPGYIGNPFNFSSISSLTFSSTVVPIPGAVWLFVSGLGLLGWLKRKAAVSH